MFRWWKNKACCVKPTETEIAAMVDKRLKEKEEQAKMRKELGLESHVYDNMPMTWHYDAWTNHRYNEYFVIFRATPYQMFALAKVGWNLHNVTMHEAGKIVFTATKRKAADNASV